MWAWLVTVCSEEFAVVNFEEGESTPKHNHNCQIIRVLAFLVEETHHCTAINLHFEFSVCKAIDTFAPAHHSANHPIHVPLESLLRPILQAQDWQS